jgi:hypothetical protein
MPADNTAALAAATRRRAESTRQRARAALQNLDRAGAPITYTSVAHAAGISRAMLYRDPQLREQINRLRSSATRSPRQPAAQRMSQASRNELLTTLREEVQALRAENHALRLQLATRIGQDRAASRGASVSDM